MNTEQKGWREEFEKDFPPFRGIGAPFPIFEETPNRNHVIHFIERTLQEQKEEMVKTIEAKMLERIYYIGHELPQVANDVRNKFVLLGTPAEFIALIKDTPH